MSSGLQMESKDRIIQRLKIRLDGIVCQFLQLELNPARLLLCQEEVFLKTKTELL